MNYKPIVIVAGEPNSVFLEIFFKSLKKKSKSPIILVASHQLVILQMKKLKIKKKIKLLQIKNLKNNKLNNNSINLINVNYKTSKAFEKISTKSKKYIEDCFSIALKLIKDNYTSKFINGPISKKYFLNKKFLGITEYIANKFFIKNFAMLIYNKKLAVCPLTTHLPLAFVPRNINRKKIQKTVKLIDNFYTKKIGFKPIIGVTGLNPHCESNEKYNLDDKVIRPSVKFLRKSGYKIFGPFPSDTIFLKKNRKKFNVILGMYHDQVLTPLKTLFEYDAINITLGLPFTRISPDHGPNEKMLGKNKSNPLSLIKAINFLNKN
jgi:4-hydroxythreonine-4-phosphate dehydrogenase